MKNKGFKFTEEQIDYIIQNWGKESTYRLKKRFGCNWYSVAKIAKENGLELPTSNDWTNEEIETLKLLSKDYHYEDIALKIGKPKTAIYQKARKMGITLIQTRREWTKEEEDYLYERWGRDTIEKIATNMKRSISAIRIKATRMGLGYMSQANIDEISVADVSKMLKVGIDRIIDTWIKLGLKLKKKKVTKNYSYYCISFDNLMVFLKEHQDLWNSKNLEKNILGKEPEWLIEKRKQDLINPPVEYKAWTNEEIELAKTLLLKGYNYKQIAIEVNHSSIGVAYKLRRLGLSYRLSTYWKGKEIKYLEDNYKNMSYAEIGEKLGRTAKAVCAKVKELGYQKKLVIKKEKK